MLPANLEYLLLLLTLTLFSLTLFASELKEAVATRPFWVAMAGYLSAGFLLDLTAQKLGWWEFNNTKVLGPMLLSVPLEEFLLFALVFLLAIGAWLRFTAK